MSRVFFSSESVAEGHPDKLCDQISDAVLDDVLRQDTRGRVACETYVTMGLVIVGGEMTHPRYLESDGGFILSSAPRKIYEIAASLGVKDFVVPGNKPERIAEYKKFLESRGVKPVFYSPGLITQGGNLTESAKAAGDRWHAIIGRALYRAENIRKEAEIFVSRIV